MGRLDLPLDSPVATSPNDARHARVDTSVRTGVAAVVVTYFPDLTGLRELVDAVRAQVDHLILLDNTPSERSPAELSLWQTPAFEVVFNGRNVGLGAAQNLGIQRARALGMSFVLLLDQDSMPACDMVQRLLAGLATLDRRGIRAAAVGPRSIDPRTGEDAAFVRYGWGWARKIFCRNCTDVLVPCDTLVASGSLTPVAALDRVGMMDASLFIDQIDSEWDMRAARHGLPLYGVCDAILHHGIGEATLRVWFVGWRRTPIHHPVRDYYLVRNIITVYFRRSALWRWRAFHFFRLLGLAAVMVTQMPLRSQRARMILLGVRDALAGRLGPFDLAGRIAPPKAASSAPTALTPNPTGSRIGRLRRLLGNARRAILPRRARMAARVVALVAGRRGLEIGGPSPVFDRHGLLPVYPAVGHLDNCNYAPDTVWGSAADAARFVFDSRRPPGRQWICEATALTPFDDGSAEFLLSSHALEHCANPIKALHEWRRVLAPGGTLVLVLPHKSGTFDHRRPTTSLAHLIADAENGCGEDDLTHLDEILSLHDLERDREAGDLDAFRARSLRNLSNRALHHHVFDTRSAVQLVDHVGLEIVAVDTARTMHIIIVARRPAAEPESSAKPDNARFLDALAAHLVDSVFALDRPPG